MIIIEICLLTIEAFLCSSLIKESVFNADDALLNASKIAVFSIILNIILWRRLSKEWLSPYMIFLIVMFLFSCGQSIGWVLNLNMGDKDLWGRVDHGLTRELLTNGLCYSILGITAFQLGAVVFYNPELYKINQKRYTADEVTCTFQKVGKILILFAVPAFIAQTVQLAISVMNGGYHSYYETILSRSAFGTLLTRLSDFYEPVLLVLLVGYRKEKNKVILIVFLLFIDIIASLYIGGRSGAVMIALGVILALHYFVKPIKGKMVVFYSAIGYLGIAVLNTIANIRNVIDKSFSTFIISFLYSLQNVIGDFIGELGWTMTSTCWTMNLTESQYPFRYGMSYLVSVVSWVPSFVFGGVHPCTVWADLGNWLQSSLGMGYGPGYTMIAESYLNFSWYGVLAMFVEGTIIVRVISRVQYIHLEDDLFGTTFQIMVIMTIMKSLVRSSLSVAMRSTVFVILPLYVLLKISLKNSKERSL